MFNSLYADPINWVIWKESQRKKTGLPRGFYQFTYSFINQEMFYFIQNDYIGHGAFNAVL